MLLRTSNIMRLREILNDLLSGPAAMEQSSLRLRETPFHIWDKTIVGTRSSELVRILEINGLVCST